MGGRPRPGRRGWRGSIPQAHPVGQRTRSSPPSAAPAGRRSATGPQARCRTNGRRRGLSPGYLITHNLVAGFRCDAQHNHSPDLPMFDPATVKGGADNGPQRGAGPSGRSRSDKGRWRAGRLITWQALWHCDPNRSRKPLKVLFSDGIGLFEASQN